MVAALIDERLPRRWSPLGSLVAGLVFVLSARVAMASDPPPCAPITGEVRMAGQRVPVADAIVLAVSAPEGAIAGDYRPPIPPIEARWSRSQRSDTHGRFSFDDLPECVVQIAILAPGYERRDWIVSADLDSPTELRLFIPASEDFPFRTVVTTRSIPRSQVTEHVLTRQEIATLPGSQGDPLRALQNLPGVARPPIGLGVLVIRGAAPSQSQVFIGGHAVPRAFHILSLASIFPADILDELHYQPGNFDAAYGNATGGVVVISPRRGRTDGFHGYAEADLAAASAMVEGPWGKGSFIVAAQRAYIDGVLATAAGIGERVTGEPTNLLLPRYFDYQALFDYPVGRGGWIGVRVFGAGDELKARNSPQFAARSDFRLRTGFHRVDLVYRVIRSRWQVRLTPSFQYENNRLVAGNDSFRRRRRDAITSIRAEFSHQLGHRATLTAGTDLALDGFFVLDKVRDPTAVGNPLSSSGPPEQGLQSSLGVYATPEIRMGPLHLRPGVRASAFSVGPRFAFAIDPRMAAHLDITERWQLSAGLGRYSQVRSISDRNEVSLVDQGLGVPGASLLLPAAFGNLDPAATFAPQDTQLNVREALHASLSVKYRVDDRYTAELGGFLRDQHNNIPPISNGNLNSFDSTSRSVGLEALVRMRVGNRLYGWVGYTLSFSELILLQSNPGFPYSRRPSDYDQRHNGVLLASYALPKHWRIGGRFRVVSGLPYSPVIGSVAFPDAYLPVFGRRNTARLPFSHQLDIRVDKQWIRDRIQFTAYFDVQNVYNRVNPELVVYSADYRSEAGYVGLPIFPSIGLRLDY